MPGSFLDCWLVMGDFNAVLGAHEKIGKAPAARPCREFKSFIDASHLSIIPIRGAKYTWCNGHL